MNSKYDEELTSFIGNAEKNLIQAAEPTKCVMISEENWESIVKTLEAQLKAMDRLGTLLNRTLTAEQTCSFINQMTDIHIKHEQYWMEELTGEAKTLKTELEEQSKKMMTDLTSQAGKMSEQSATVLAKIKMEMQVYSDRLYHRLLLPCLLTTLLSAVLTLWLVLQL